MKKLFCESIVYCDLLLIILLIVGLSIDNKVFVCLLIYTKAAWSWMCRKRTWYVFVKTKTISSRKQPKIKRIF